MKKMVCLLISMFCICVFGLSNVLAIEAVKIGNPSLVQFPNNDVKASLARSVWGLHNYNDRIYVGTGDLVYNQGPINVWSFDAEGNFMNEFTVDDEQILIFRSYNKKLFIPGSDARDSWAFGNLYVKDNDVWEKFRTIPNGVHVRDVAVFQGNVYMLIRTPTATEILESSDLQTWQVVSQLPWSVNVGDYRNMVPLDDFLIVIGTTKE